MTNKKTTDGAPYSDMTIDEFNSFYRGWAKENGCDECKHFMKRQIVCSKNCMKGFFKDFDSGKI